MTPKTVLLDLFSPMEDWAAAEAAIAGADLLGLDCETQDRDRHPGLDAVNTKKKVVFDVNRINMTGFSFYADGSDTSYYVNLLHADVENRVPPEIALKLLEARKPGSIWLSHNAPFEMMAFRRHNVELNDLICTLQMAVSHHNPDEYDPQAFADARLDCLYKLVPDILQQFSTYDPEKQSSRSLTSDQAFVLGQFVGKESKASHSYNGFVDSISYGYGLKKLVKSIFGHQMTTFEETLAAHGAADMGDLTGEQVAAYGADDAYWVVPLYKHFLASMMRTNPALLVTFFEGEAPMAREFAAAWTGGLRLDVAEIGRRQIIERDRYAAALRRFKGEIRALLPFPDEPSQTMLEKQDWYAKNDTWKKKRKQIEDWANSPDSDDSYTQCTQISNPVGNAWMLEKGKTQTKGILNITYYQSMRTLLHDLMGHKLVRIGGEISTDSEARARMLATFDEDEDDRRRAVLRSLTELSSIEQSFKLYISPYSNLLDPDTGRVYPVITSMLASHRMAMANPNGMQLAKRGDAKYVRGFFEADNDEHIIVSADWSAVELVLIGEQSGDPEFAKVYGQDPHGDLHSSAAVACLKVNPDFADIELDEFKLFKFNENPNGRWLKNFQGDTVSAEDFYKLYRSTEVGKGANFSYWFSGALASVADRLGLTDSEHWALVDSYRQTFAVAEEWRTGVIDEVRSHGFVTLPDHHRRVRLEATDFWRNSMRRKFAMLSAAPAMNNYAELAIKRISSRAGNQAVNTKIQGMCARLAKDTIIHMRHTMDNSAARHMMPIHDELVYSVHKDYAPEFIPLLRHTMCNHPKYVSDLKLMVNVAVGRTFKPYDAKSPAFSQIELDEAPIIDGLIAPELRGKSLPAAKIAEVIDFVASAKRAA